MTTFDGWEARLCGDAMAVPSDELMHFRTKGSKNGVRRYQQEDGTWTPLGLRERKAREGWGESRAERRANRQMAKAERKSARIAKRTERREAFRKALADHKEKKRLGDVSKLSDAELKKKLERVKMEQEYKEMTRSPILKSGEKLFNTILDYKARKQEAAADLAKSKLENNRVAAEIIKAKEMTKTAKAQASAAKSKAKTAKSEAKKQKWDTKGGLEKERQAQLQNAKTNYRNTTIRGAIGKHFNNMASYRQTVRMNPYKAKEHQRAAEMAKLAIEREKWKSKSGGKK